MSVANRPVQSQEVRNLKFQISEEEGFPIYAVKLKNLMSDQICSYYTADLGLCFCIPDMQNLVFS